MGELIHGQRDMLGFVPFARSNDRSPRACLVLRRVITMFCSHRKHWFTKCGTTFLCLQYVVRLRMWLMSQHSAQYSWVLICSLYRVCFPSAHFGTIDGAFRHAQLCSFRRNAMSACTTTVGGHERQP